LILFGDFIFCFLKYYGYQKQTEHFRTILCFLEE